MMLPVDLGTRQLKISGAKKQSGSIQLRRNVRSHYCSYDNNEQTGKQDFLYKTTYSN